MIFIRISVTWYSPVVQRISAKNKWMITGFYLRLPWLKLSIDSVGVSLYIYLSFCSGKTKGHCSENHSFSEAIDINDRLWTMKVVIEHVRKFICVIKTKFLCLWNFHFPAQPTSRFHSIYPE